MKMVRRLQILDKSILSRSVEDLKKLMENYDGLKAKRVSPLQRFRIAGGQAYDCALCGKRLGVNFHIDHALPSALGGKSDDDNLFALHPDCHADKSSMEQSVLASVRRALNPKPTQDIAAGQRVKAPRLKFPTLKLWEGT